jgi:two-component system cell cycle sensor histidine kinase/response regulator CckA
LFDAIRDLFATDDFSPRWSCGNWSDVHGWTHIVADTAIFAAYAAIPCAITYFVLRRREVVFPRLYWLFAAFIFSCGFGHLIEASIFWQPWYRFSGLVKVITAVVSWATVLALLRYVPLALDVPGIARLNDRLRAEIEVRERAEAEVRRLNVDLLRKVGELEAVLDVLPVGIGIALDPDCREIRANAAFARMLRVTTDSNVSLGAANGEAPEHFEIEAGGVRLEPHQLPMQRASHEGLVIRDFEEEIVFTDGERYSVLASAAPLFDEHGAVRGAVGAFVDITARKEEERRKRDVERDLLETQKLESLGILAGGIAHDFNNLLTGVMGSASLARLELPPTSPVLVHVDHVERAAQRAADLCKQMLAYSGRGRFVLEDIDLSSLVEEMSYLLRTSINKKAQLRFQLARDLPAVHADATQLRQVVMNLVINASEAIGTQGGLIGFSTGFTQLEAGDMRDAIPGPELPPGRYVHLEVSDTGCGMARDTLKRIFEPFFTTKFTGRGLGLAAVLGIVRGHGGALKVYSEVGHGTTFKILLPCQVTAPKAITAGSGRTATWRGCGNVLVVDDDDSVRTVVSRMLEQLGLQVTVASDGRAALEAFRTCEDGFRLVLLDLTMPHLDGEQTFRELRLIDPEVEVLLMSGFNEQEAISRFAGKGLAGFLQKPFRIDALAAKLRELLDHS